MMPAQQAQVVDVGGSAVLPPPQMMGVDVAGQTARESTAGSVAEPQGAALGPVGHPLAAPQVEGLAVTVDQGTEPGVAGQAAGGLGADRGSVVERAAPDLTAMGQHVVVDHDQDL